MILLDTHVITWLLSGDRRLGLRLRRVAPYREKPKTFFGMDKGRYPFLQEAIDILDRGEGADVVWEAEQGLIDGKPC